MADTRDPNLVNSGQQYIAGGGIGGRTGGRLNGPNGGMGGSGRTEPVSAQPTPIDRNPTNQNPGNAPDRRPDQSRGSGQL